MDETQQWRELLGSILYDPKEKQRIASELRLNPSYPAGSVAMQFPGHIISRLLLKTLPRYRASLLKVMPAAWKSALNSAPPVNSHRGRSRLPSLYMY